MAEKTPMRLCVGCCQMKRKSEMVRLVKMRDGSICVDGTGKRGGRGAYICKNPDCLKKALRNHGMERSLKSSLPRETIMLLRKEVSLSDG